MSTKKQDQGAVNITPPKMQTAAIKIRGIAPYVQLRFGAKATEQMRATQEAGSTAKKGKKKEAKDFEACYQDAMHVTEKGERGIPAPAFRAALISACRLVGFQMTKAKLSLFIQADAYDKDDGTPLVFIKGAPEMVIHHVRNASGVADLRARAMWREWTAILKVQFDAEQFTLADVANLILRAGQQVGIGEGRPDSKSSCGQGWGMFVIENEKK